MPTSPAEIFFNTLLLSETNPFEIVNALIKNAADENDWREFKSAAFIDAPFELGSEAKEQKRRQETVKHYWSENLSAFANSGGGLLIWGINTKGPHASNQSLAANAATLAQRLEELKNEAIDPPILGVKVLPVNETESLAGFVVCLIPNSSFAPHRAVFANGGFYIRAGDSSRSMKTEVLRRMFYPQTTHRLTPILALRVVESGNQKLKIITSIRFQNRGSASAQQVVIEIKSDTPISHYGTAGLWTESSISSDNFACRQTIHPHEEIPLFSNAGPLAEFLENELPIQLTYSFKIFTLNAPALHAELIFNQDDLSRASSATVSKEARISMIDC